MLDGKVAIITGASYGMGQTMAELFAEEGMLEGLADSTLILDGGYKVPERDDIVTIFRNSL